MKVSILAILPLAFSCLAFEHPNFAGNWLLDVSRSTGEVPVGSRLSITQNGAWLRFAEVDREAGKERSVESECKVDGRFHPVSGDQGGSILCKWQDTTLITETHWNNSLNRRTVRTTISSDGALAQDIDSTGPGGRKQSSLIWKRAG